MARLSFLVLASAMIVVANASPVASRKMLQSANPLSSMAEGVASLQSRLQSAVPPLPQLPARAGVTADLTPQALASKVNPAALQARAAGARAGLLESLPKFPTRSLGGVGPVDLSGLKKDLAVFPQGVFPKGDALLASLNADIKAAEKSLAAVDAGIKETMATFAKGAPISVKVTVGSGPTVKAAAQPQSALPAQPQLPQLPSLPVVKVSVGAAPAVKAAAPAAKPAAKAAAPAAKATAPAVKAAAPAVKAAAPAVKAAAPAVKAVAAPAVMAVPAPAIKTAALAVKTAAPAVKAVAAPAVHVSVGADQVKVSVGAAPAAKAAAPAAKAAAPAAKAAAPASKPTAAPAIKALPTSSLPKPPAHKAAAPAKPLVKVSVGAAPAAKAATHALPKQSAHKTAAPASVPLVKVSVGAPQAGAAAAALPDVNVAIKSFQDDIRRTAASLFGLSI